MTTTPDIFTNVHKGIRRALFNACLALGRAGDGGEQDVAARQLLKEALRFVAHHGENEDILLLPLLRSRAPEIATRMEEAHRRIDDAFATLQARAAEAPVHELHLRTGAFVSLYLEHMREEEQELEPKIRAALDVDALAGFSRGSVERTAPGDQKMMLGWMLPAMPRSEADTFLKRMPREVAEELGRLLDSNRL
ncbi:MAG: hemerythrin domain-containing protein [Polyangiaceae bacterium]